MQCIARIARRTKKYAAGRPNPSTKRERGPDRAQPGSPVRDDGRDLGPMLCRYPIVCCNPPVTANQPQLLQAAINATLSRVPRSCAGLGSALRIDTRGGSDRNSLPALVLGDPVTGRGFGEARKAVYWPTRFSVGRSAAPLANFVRPGAGRRQPEVQRRVRRGATDR